MHPTSHPYDIIERHDLISEDGGIAWDRDWYLMRLTGGKMVVRSVKSYDGNKTPDINQFEEDVWETTIVQGKTLAELVKAKREKFT